ncbi:hypothetical protein ACEPAH_8798 [Sanghuangporus vaninii]
MAAGFRSQAKAFRAATQKGGKVKSMPTTLGGKLVSPLQGIAILVPPLTYLVAIPLNGGIQPVFIARWSLPDFGFGTDTVGLVRLAACLGLTGLCKMYTGAIRSLDQSFRSIGVRERPKLASSGPYGIVRHPLASIALMQELVFAVISRNSIPVYAFGICDIALVVKTPIEEELADRVRSHEYLE